MEKPLIQKRLVEEKIKKIEIMEDTRSLIVHTEYALRAYRGKWIITNICSEARLKKPRHAWPLRTHSKNYMFGATQT